MAIDWIKTSRMWCLILFIFVFAGKSKQLEDKMVQQLQEDVDMGDENN